MAVALIALGVALRLFLSGYNYRGVSLYCGDSASYFTLAQHLDWAAADRPSGFPFFLRLLLTFNSSPLFLLLVNGALGIAAQLLLWRAFASHGLNPALGLALNLAVFCSPVFLKMNSMVFMADTLACFLLSLALALFLYDARRAQGSPVAITSGLLLVGYLAIVKNTFVYCGALLWAYAVLQSAWSGRNSVRRVLKLAALYGVAAAAIPAWYAIAFNGPRMNSWALENFSGRSVLSNLLSQASCADVRSAVDGEREIAAVDRHCRDEKLRSGTGEMLWHGDSVMNTIEAELVGEPYDRARGNRMLRRIALQLLWQRPQLLWLATIKNLGDHLTWSPRDQSSIDQVLNLDAGCSDLVRTYFRLEPQEYTQRWEATAQRGWLPSVKTVDRIARTYSDLLDVCAFAGLIVLLVVLPWSYRGRPLPVLCLLLTLLCLAGMTAGSFYDTRVYFMINVLVYATTALALSDTRDAAASNGSTTRNC